MKDKIAKLIRGFVKDYEQKGDRSTKWGEPLVGFADAHHPYILNLKKNISESHSLPADVLPDASIVIAYFIPFTKELANTNQIAGDIASTEWALAYEETNALFPMLNGYIISELQILISNRIPLWRMNIACIKRMAAAVFV